MDIYCFTSEIIINKEGFYQVGFVKNQILQEQNQFSHEIPHALQNTKILCEIPMWFFEVHTGFSKYQQDPNFFSLHCSLVSPEHFQNRA